MHVGSLAPIIAQDITAVQVAWIGALSALAGAIIGGSISIVGAYVLRRSELRQAARQLALGLAGEIGALIDIVERRNYVQELRKAATTAAQKTYSATVTRNYFKVFEVNANQMGLLGGDLPRLVTSFYVRASALSEDFNVISEPTFSETSTAEERAAYYNTMADLLEETLVIGRAAIAGLTATSVTRK